MKDDIKVFYKDEEFKDFKDDLAVLPYWIKNRNDLQEYCRHVTYRLIQSKEIIKWYQENVALSEEGENQILQIQVKYDAMFFDLEKEK